MGLAVAPLLYTYVRHGEEDVSGASCWVAPSDNTIDHGWSGLSHVFGGVTDSVGFAHAIFAVTRRGDLRWHRYTGHGEPADQVDAWDAQSGTVIGRGW